MGLMGPGMSARDIKIWAKESILEYIERGMIRDIENSDVIDADDQQALFAVYNTVAKKLATPDEPFVSMDYARYLVIREKHGVE